MKRSHSPCSRSSSSSSSCCESTRWDYFGCVTGPSSSKRPRRDHSSDSLRELRGRTSRRSGSSSSGDSAGRSYRAERPPRHHERREPKDRKTQVARRHRSKGSSDSDHSDGGISYHRDGGGLNGAAAQVESQTPTRAFDVEKCPYSSDNVETLNRMTIADAIKEVTEKKYDELTKNRYDQPNTYSKDRMKKVLASVVMERKISHQNTRLCIVSLGAGSKSIGGAFLTKKGNRVHDCHAEVLARRGLIRFLYSQLEEIKNGNRLKSIFEKRGEVYALQENVFFHLFISKQPCGDASVFGLHENHQNRKRRGIARVTPADGEGAIHISWLPENDKTFDDYTSNEAPARLHKMCCSAKLARWNVTGVQGALLSLYIEPVYFKSITIGSQFNVGHMKRAVYTRVSKIRRLSSTYRVNEPRLYQVSSPDDSTYKSHKMSLNWCLQLKQIDNDTLHLEGQQQASSNGEEELIECQSGLTPNLAQEVSRLAKMELFKVFISLWDSLAPRALKQRLPGVSRNQQPYSTVKSLAVAYQEGKAKVAECFAEMPYGSRWLKMPPEVDQFSMADLLEENENDTGDSD